MSENAPEIGIVLSGGGARGAYEAGVLRYVLDDLPKELGHPVEFDVICGSSVGAVHAAYLAAVSGQEGVGRRLTDLWCGMSISDVFRVGARNLLSLGRRMIGSVPKIPFVSSKPPERLGGLVDARPLEQLVLESIPWRNIRRNLKAGRPRALCVTATDIETGKTVVFIDGPSEEQIPWVKDPFVLLRAVRLHATHALASAAIPILFPAVRIEGKYYCDGGLRMNVPLAPALRLGVDRLLVIGLRSPLDPSEDGGLPGERLGAYGSPIYLAGKVFNTLLVDRIEYDIDRMRLLNALFREGNRLYGDAFLGNMNRVIESRRGVKYRIIEDCYIRPSEDPAKIAAQQFVSRPWSVAATNIFLRITQGGSPKDEADLLSYVFFDKSFAEKLVELGYEDAKAAHDDLVALFRPIG